MHINISILAGAVVAAAAVLLLIVYPLQQSFRSAGEETSQAGRTFVPAVWIGPEPGVAQEMGPSRRDAARNSGRSLVHP